MGQPGKSVPGEPIRHATDYVAWLTATLDGLNLGCVSLAGMSFGGWVALKYAKAAPERVHHLVLLSPGGLLPMVRQFRLRAMLMVVCPTRFTVNSFMRWAGIRGPEVKPVLDLTYLGLKHFRMPPETIRADRDAANLLSDDELRSVQAPVLLLFGDREVIYDPARALARANRLIPHVDGELIPGCRHDMCFTQRRIVDARVLEFLKSEDSRIPCCSSVYSITTIGSRVRVATSAGSDRSTSASVPSSPGPIGRTVARVPSIVTSRK